MVETWVEEKGWKKVNEKLSKKWCIWRWQTATKKHLKQRAERGMRIRKEFIEKSMKMAVKEEGIVMEYVRQGKEKWKIVKVYVNRWNIEQKLRKIEHGWRIRKRVKTIIGKDSTRKQVKKVEQ